MILKHHTNKLLTILFIGGLMITTKKEAFSQSSNPTLSTLNYSFTNYTGSSMPASLKVGRGTSSSLSTSDFTTDATYGTSGGQWDDEGANGISYRGNGTNPSGCFKIRLNTTGLSNIRVAWTARRADNETSSSSFMDLQWRNGSVGSWTNVTGDQYDSDNASTSFSLILPSGADNLGDLQVRWVVYDQNHIFGSRDMIGVDDINICAAPSVSASNGGPICSGNTLSLLGTPAGMSYSWTGPNGFTSTAQNPSITNAASAATGTYSLIVTNGSGCTSSTTTSATVNTTPNATANNSNACDGQTLSLTSGPNGFSYQWSGPGGYSSTSQNPNRSNASSLMDGAYTVTVTNAGCSSTATTNVTVNPVPSASAALSGTACTGSDLNLTSLPSGGSYAWSGPAGFSSAAQNPVRTNSLLSHSGTYTVTVTVAGCSSTASTAVTVNTSPVVNPTSSANTVCEGIPVGINANSSLTYQNSTAIAIPDNNVTGSSSSLTLPAVSIANAASMEVVLTFTPEHTYTGDVVVRLTNPAAETTTLFDRPGVPATTFGNSDDLNGTYTFSTGASTVLPESTGTMSSGGNINQGSYRPSNASGSGHNWSGYTFPVSASGNWTINVSDRVGGDIGTLASWSIRVYTNTGITYTWTSTPSGFTSSSSSINPTPIVNTTYSVVATYNGCNSITGNKSISVNPAPSPVANSNGPVCDGLNLNFSGNNAAIGQSSGNTYQWSGPNGFSSNQQNPNINGVSSLHAGNYIMTITNQFLCTATASINVGVNPNPTLSIVSQTNVSCNGFTDGSYTVAALGGGSNYLYDDGFSFNFDGIFNGNPMGNYIAHVMDDNGCEALVNVTITEPAVLALTETHVDELCTGLNNGTITITPSGGTAPYQYSIDNGATFQGSASFNTVTAGNYVCTISDANNCPVSSVPVAIVATYINFTAPTSIVTDDADNQICFPNPINMTQIGGDLGNAPGTTYKWHVGSCGSGSLAGSGVSGVLSTSPSVNTSYYLNIEGICGVSNCVPLNLIVSTAAPVASVTVPITGLPFYACNNTQVALSVPAVANATQYLWDAPVGSNFESTSNIHTTLTPNATLTFGTTANSGYYIGVQAANACGSSLRKAQWVRGIVSVPAAVISNTGSFTHCENTTATFNCAPIIGATDYDWTITGNATLIPNMNSVTVMFHSTWNGGVLSVAAKTPCYISPYKSVSLTTSASPTTQLTGVFTGCPGALQTYSISPVSGASNYTWTLPANTSGSSNSNSINVNINNGFVQGDICVQVTSNCGVVSPIKCKTITSGSPARPASISGFTSGICGQLVSYQTPPVAGGTFNWTLPPNSTGSSTSNVIAATLPNNLSNGQVCVSVTNNCGTSNLRCVTVKGAPNAPSSISVTPAVVCANEAGVQFTADLSNMSGVYSLEWIYPASATYIAGQSTSNLILDWGANSGNVKLKATNSCGAATRVLMVPISCRNASLQQEPGLEIVNENIIEISPNPANSFVKIRSIDPIFGESVIKITDLQGRILFEKEVENGQLIDQTIDVSGFSRGTYFVNFESESAKKQSKIVLY